MPIVDLTTMTDQEIDTLQSRITVEKETRRNLQSIPGKVSALARTYAAGGGDPGVLEQAISGDE